MAQTEVKRHVTRGDSRTYDQTITDIPAGLTISTAWFTVKAKLTDTYANAVIKKKVTSTLNADGQITDTGADGTGVARFLLTPTNTRTLVAGRRYFYDIQARTSDGQVGTVESGYVLVDEEVTEEDS